MEWYVHIYENGSVRAINVFDNLDFYRGIKEMFDVPEQSYEEIEMRVKQLAKWKFFNNYEFVMSSWPESASARRYKIDIFDQLMLNWNHLIDYIYGTYCLGEDA